MAVSDHIGFGTALLLSLCSAILGGALVKHQGIKTFFAFQESLQSGNIPSKELFDGLCLAAAGAMLITPGFVTDALGFSLLIPQIRDFLRQKLAASARFQNVHFETNIRGNEQTYEYHTTQSDKIIEGEYETLSEDDKP